MEGLNNGLKVVFFSDQNMKGRRELSYYLEEDEKVNDYKVCYMFIVMGDLNNGSKD